MAEQELGEVMKLVAQLKQAEAEAEQKEQELKKVKERIVELSQRAIPEAMKELGYRKVSLSDGSEVSYKSEVYCSLPEAKKEPAYRWLEEHGAGSLIKNETVIEFDKGDAKRLAEVVEFLNEKGVNHATKRSVHAMTLKAYIKEQMSAGADIPLEMFGAIAVDVATVKKNEPKFTLGG